MCHVLHLVLVNLITATIALCHGQTASGSVVSNALQGHAQQLQGCAHSPLCRCHGHIHLLLDRTCASCARLLLCRAPIQTYAFPHELAMDEPGRKLHMHHGMLSYAAWATAAGLDGCQGMGSMDGRGGYTLDHLLKEQQQEIEHGPGHGFTVAPQLPARAASWELHGCEQLANMPTLYAVLPRLCKRSRCLSVTRWAEDKVLEGLSLPFMSTALNNCIMPCGLAQNGSAPPHVAAARPGRFVTLKQSAGQKSLRRSCGCCSSLRGPGMRVGLLGGMSSHVGKQFAQAR
jgi:hypothetical protein